MECLPVSRPDCVSRIASSSYAPRHVRPRLTSRSVLTRWRGLTGAFSARSLRRAEAGS